MFNTKQITIIVLITILSLLFVGVSLVSASDWTFSYVEVPASFNCSPNRVISSDGSIAYNLPATAKITSREFINGELYATMSSSISGNGRHSFPIFSSVFPTQQSYPYVYTVSYSVTVSGELISQSSLSVRCESATSAVVTANGVDYAESEEAAVASPPDARFNWGFGDSHIAIVYPDGESISLYLYEGEVFIPNFLTADDIAVYADNPPAENTLVASAGSVDAYILTTGEIQFNIGPDAEGKQYVLIMSDLSGSDLYGYSIDPNE